MTDRSPSAIDCFAGAGGLSLGLRRAGFALRAAFDNDPAAMRTYVRNLGDHGFVARAEEITADGVLERARLAPGECSLIAGGPPCQGFSVQRRGTDVDDRNGMVLEFLRIVLGVRPVMFLMENVSAIAGKRGRHYLQEITRRAQDAGYRIHSRILDAAEFGVPQRRRRMFIVGELDDGYEYFAFPAPRHSAENFVTVRQAIADLPSPAEDRGIPNHEADKISALNRLRISHVPPGGGREHIPPELRLPCHTVSVARIGHRNVYGRLDWDSPAGTITTKCNSFTRGKFAHPQEDRNITMREAARLQSFPDAFVFEGDKVAVAHQIGNAVPPLLAEQIGCSLIQALEARAARRGRPASSGQLALGLGD